MNEAYLLPGLLLAVLAWPLAAAIWVWRCRESDTARRTAAYLAAGHLILTAAFVVLGAGTVELAASRTTFSAFQPFAVPGDPGLASGAARGATTWSFLQVLPDTPVQFFLGVDGLNLPLVALTSLMTFLAVLVSWESLSERANGYFGWLFLLQAACLGAFLSYDLLLFYVFFELTLVPAFFLIGQWGGGGGRRDAARKFFLYTLFGSLFTLVGLLGIAIVNPTPVDASGKRVSVSAARVAMPREGAITFSVPQLMENVYVWDEAHAAAAKRGGDAVERLKDRRELAMWLFFALMAGFAVKVPLVPFHTWLPAAYGEAPLAVTMLLSAIMAKLGTFGILRIVLPLAPEPAVAYGLSVFGTLGAIGVVYAALCAFAQRDLKQLAAYSSVSHLGFLSLALFAATPESLTGATLHMVNHGLTAGALFALLAFLADRYRTLDVNQYSGLWARFPQFAFFFIVLALAAVGLPGLNNFASEMLMLSGLFDPRNLAGGLWLAVAAAAGLFLTAWYTFTVIRKVFFGPVKEPTTETVSHDLTAREGATFGLLAALCLALGLYPQPVINLIAADADRVAMAIESARERLQPGQRSPADDRPPATKARAHP